MVKLFTRAGTFVLFFLLIQLTLNGQQKRLYLSNDDHTDYMWSANEAGYQTAILTMLDWWIHYNDSTKIANANPYYQSKWNCDGSLWVSLYEKYRTGVQFDSLITQIKSGQITVPYSPLVTTYGAMPAEAVLRGMYYAGSLERRKGVDLTMATAMENQTMPLGLSSLWKGAGAKYCWHGVCNCDTKITGFDNRNKEIYWYKGLDTNRILLKWYRMDDTTENYYLGGYGEALLEQNAISGLSAKCDSAGYPYTIAAAFGVGHDNLLTTEDHLVEAAKTRTNASEQVIVSNEVDFFEDFQNNYGNDLVEKTQTFGNEWDLNCASIAEVSAKIKRSLEKLRAAEAMAAIVINYAPVFMDPLDTLRKQAWQSLGLFWEHSMGFNNSSSGVAMTERNAFQRRLEQDFSTYVDQLYDLAKSNLGNLITNGTSNPRFFAFNPLGWIRTDYADYKYNGSHSIHVMDMSTSLEVPIQFITKNNIDYLRVLASNIPSVGYKVFEIQNNTGAVFPDAGTNAGNVLENDYFKITYTSEGVLTSIKDKLNANRELVTATGGRYVNDMGSGTGNNGTVPVVEIGKVSITVSTQSLSTPAHTTKITLFKSIPRIEIDNQITQNFNDSVRTWSYSFDVPAPTVWHEETGAVIKAKLTTNGGHYAPQNARYDWSTLNHFASVNENSGYGVSLSNQDCYFMKIGSSTVATLDENSAQLNVLAGGTIGGLGIQNQGDDNIFNQRFAITTHTVYSAADEMKKALEHQNFLVCDTVVSPVSFLLPNEYSFVKNNDPGSLIYTVKPAEEGSTRGIITRVWNLSNTDVSTTLDYNLFIDDARRTTHVETDMNPISISVTVPKTLPIALGGNEMKTFLVKLHVFALPVKLLSFKGEKINNVNELRWETANEANLKEYLLERSLDGHSFGSIAAVTATGSVSGYAYTDKNVNPLVPCYYRLKMINSDYSFSYSSIIIIKAAAEAANLIVYPNPVIDEIKVNLILDKQIRCNVMIVNAAGMVVKTASPPLFERGYNNYSMSVKELPAGAYNFVIIAADKKFTQSFIKK